MKNSSSKTLSIVGALALLAWTLLGLLAWVSVGRRLTLVSSDEEAEPRAPTELLALADEVASLHGDLRALAEGMGQNLEGLHDALIQAQDERAAALELQVAALRDQVVSRKEPSPSSGELGDLVRELRALRDALAASPVSDSAAQLASPEPPINAEPEPTIASEPVPEPPAAAAPAPVVARERKSFLAFKLPSDDFRFDERRRWDVLPALSRVGFDAKTTLHDFTATTSSLEGQLEADLSRPGEAPRAHLSAQAASLESGNEERDASMREHLATERFPSIEFTLERFEPSKVEPGSLRASGLVHGTMTIRGVTREVAMPVQISIDDARRMGVEGEMTLDLTDYSVPVPSKLGLISMDEEVRVWISLKLRVAPRSEG